GGRRPGRGVPDARRRHRRRDRVRARPARVGSHAGVSGARARRAGRGRARRRGVCRSAVRRSRAPRRQRAAAGAGGALCAGGAGRRDAHPLMPLDFVIDRLDALPATRALAEGLPASGARQGIAGLPGSSPAVLVAALARRLPQRVFVVVTPTPTDAERWLADLRTLTGTAVLYPQREALGAEEPHFEIAGERVETLQLLLSGQARALVTTARAAAERTGVPAALHRQWLWDLPPSEALVVLEQESALGQEVERAWAEAAHHLEVARRLGEEPPAREALFVDPAAWRAQLVRFPRIALDPADAD